MRLHSLALPHTRLTSQFSHCAYSGKIARWGPMMRAQGYETVLYSVGQPDDLSGWSRVVEVLTPEEQCALLGYDPLGDPKKFIGDAAHVGNKLYTEFNRRLRSMLSAEVSGDDQVCLHFGHGHAAALDDRVLREHALEPGIGYPTCVTGYRIYESWAVYHWQMGHEKRYPWLSEWVVPNYYNVDEWPRRWNDLRTGYVLYFGRLNWDKGLNVVWQLAKARPDLEFVLCGQGDPTPYLTEPNIRYEPPKHGMERAALIHGARVMLVPSQYVEPFGGVAVEAQLTGTPVVTSDHSAFTETVLPEFRARTKEEFLAAMERAESADVDAIRDRAIRLYGMHNVGSQFDHILQVIPAMRREGFNATRA